MNPKTHNLTVRGIKLRTRTPRRFAVVAVRPEPVTRDGHTYVACAEVLKRTDSLDTARAKRRSFGIGIGSYAVIVDLTTGEEIQ
jgi:hypothetical protein